MPKLKDSAGAKKSKKSVVESVMPPAEPPVELKKELEYPEEVVQREIIYPKFEVLEYSTISEYGPITPDDMRERILGWETEKSFVARKLAEYPQSKEADWLFLDDFHCYDTNGEKVRCWNNAGNRPFDEEWCKKLTRMILWGYWSGPLTVPGETINGECIRISKYGRVLSGQHQGTALVLADEWLKKSRNKEFVPYYDPDDPESEKYKFWIGHKYPVIETLVVTGLSEDERVLRTIDYVKTRTMADMLYTMPLFRWQEYIDEDGKTTRRLSTPPERNELTRMLASAVNILWIRTKAKGYGTHPEIVGFLDRHKRLLQCVQHLFLLNQPVRVNKKRLEGETQEQHKARLVREEAEGGRRISKLHMSAGQCAAMMYLMGCSATDATTSDAYRNPNISGQCDKNVAPSEDTIDWSMWDKARLFWERLAGDNSFKAVRIKLNSLMESNTEDEGNMGLGGRFPEKMAVIAKAWDVFKDHQDTMGDPFPVDKDEEGRTFYPDLEGSEGALQLAYSNKDEKGNTLPDGKIRLISSADFLGIDVPQTVVEAKEPEPDPTPEVIEANGRKIQDEKAKRADEKKEKSRKPKPEPGALDRLAEKAAKDLGNTKKPIQRK